MSRTDRGAARLEPVGRLALPGGGQIVVEGRYAYVGHIAPPHGTTILDVADPARPRIVAEVPVPESRPVPVATYQVDPDGLAVPGQRFGAHQPWEHVRDDNLVFLAWFSGGVRVVDLSDPYRPCEVAAYVPEPGRGRPAAQTNDVCVDRRGLVYAIDRYEGLSVLALRRPA